MNTKRAYILLLAGMMLASVAHAETEQTSSTVAGFGALSSGGAYTNISSGRSPGGYLQTFSLRPDLDTDGDGLHDEIDDDNDGDLLADIDEITGALFDPVTPTHPNLADADGDGVNDGEEMIAGTNPGDANSVLEVVSITRAGTGAEIQWSARGGKQYILLVSTDLTAGFVPVATNQVAGGEPPWFTTTGKATVSGEDSYRAYAVEARP
jgi:hypothetical protein